MNGSYGEMIDSAAEDDLQRLALCVGAFKAVGKPEPGLGFTLEELRKKSPELSAKYPSTMSGLLLILGGADPVAGKYIAEHGEFEVDRQYPVLKSKCESIARRSLQKIGY